MLRIQAEALTFDDVSLVPAHSTVLPRDVSLRTKLTRDLELNLPIASAAMDTVTEARLAIAMAQLGGIGILHKNMSLQQQAAHVAQVKQFEADTPLGRMATVDEMVGPAVFLLSDAASFIAGIDLLVDGGFTCW